MSLSFVIPEFNIGGAGTPPIQFFRRGFNLGGSGSQPSWRDVILSGNTALTLVNAKANGLNYLKLFGGTEQSGTPTPDNPVDIVCNNGALKYSPNELNPDEIEIGYYIASSTGVLTESDYNFMTGFMPVKPSRSYVFFGRRIEDDRLSSYNRIHWFDSNQEYISTNTYTKDTVGKGVAPANAYFAKCSCNESGATSRVTTQEIVDGYNWVFGCGTAEVPYIPYAEGGLYIDGTTEVINIHGKNYINVANYTVPSNANYNNVWSGSLTGQFTLSVDRSQITSVTNKSQRFVVLTVDGTTSYINYNACGSIQIDGTLTSISIVGSNAYARAVGKVSLQLESGATATTYEPYFNGGTATAEMLLKVGDYQDVQSVLDGAVTRNVGVKVLDGTETWSYSQGVADMFQYNIGAAAITNRTVVCTHFKSSESIPSVSERVNGYAVLSSVGALAIGYSEMNGSVSTFKQWLTDQYANGTPVVVVYPLATATTETVTAQPLTIQAGTNIVEITQASIDNLELEVSYKAGVEVTVTEIENAQLDNSVEVTVNG